MTLNLKNDEYLEFQSTETYIYCSYLVSPRHRCHNSMSLKRTLLITGGCLY